MAILVESHSIVPGVIEIIRLWPGPRKPFDHVPVSEIVISQLNNQTVCVNKVYKVVSKSCAFAAVVLPNESKLLNILSFFTVVLKNRFPFEFSCFPDSDLRLRQKKSENIPWRFHSFLSISPCRHSAHLEKEANISSLAAYKRNPTVFEDTKLEKGYSASISKRDIELWR